LDWVSEERRPAFIGLFGFLVGVAFLVGNICGIFLLMLDIERRTIFLIAAFFASLATLYGLAFIEESLVPKKRRPLFCSSDSSGSTDAESPGKASAHTKADCEAVGMGLICLWCTRFFHALAGAIIFSTYAFLIDQLFGWTDLQFGVVMAVCGTLYALLQFSIYPLLGAHGKAGSAASAMVANISGVFGCIFFSTPIVAMHMLALSLLTVTGALFEPAVPVLVSIFAGESHLGFGNGVSTACRCAANIIGPFIGGLLFEKGLYYLSAAGCAMYFLGTLGSVGIFFSPSASEGESKPLLVSSAKA